MPSGEPDPGSPLTDQKGRTTAVARRINKGYRRIHQATPFLYRAVLYNKDTGERWTEGPYTTPKAARGVIGLRKTQTTNPETGESPVTGHPEMTRTSWYPVEEKKQ